MLDLKKRKRPRKCKICHQDATFVEQSVVIISIIRQNGSIERNPFIKGYYYCDIHSDITE